MKFQLTNEKELKWLIPLVLIVSLYFLVTNIYDRYKVNDIDPSEKKELMQFIEEHNASLQANLKKDLKGEDEPEEDGDVPMKENNESVYEGEIDENGNPKDDSKKGKNEVTENKPYTEPLPEMPDEDLNNQDIYGIDSNNNGVRDDVEILIAKTFKGNGDATRFMMASYRYQQMMLKLSEYPQTEETDDSFSYIGAYYGSLYDCAYDALNKVSPIKVSEFYGEKYYDKIQKFWLNTPERRAARKYAMQGYSSGGGTAGLSYNKCLEMVKQSYIDMNKDVTSFNFKMIVDRGL